MKILFVSGNKDKIKEASYILAKFGINVQGMRVKFKELINQKLEDVVIDKARQISRVIKEPFIVDDAGIFFEAYPDFPGTFTKYIFDILKYKGILKLLEGKKRRAYFKAVIAYKKPNGKIWLFKDSCKGLISPEVRGPISLFSPFNRLFIPDGEDKTFAELGIKKQIKISHRANALRKFAYHIIGSKKKRRV